MIENRFYLLNDKIRKYINSHRYQSVYIADHDIWNQICSSLDVLDDTQSAIRSYSESAFPDEIGSKYLIIFGLLQALFVQQDAIKHLSEALGFEYVKHTILNEIREIRNSSIGHPTRRGRDKETLHFYHIVQHSISKKGFQLIQYMDNNRQMIRVDLNDIIEKQHAAILNQCELVLLKFKELEKTHKEMFKNNRLQDILHSGMSYAFQQISEGISGKIHDQNNWGRANLEIVTKTYRKFKDELFARGDLTDSIEYDLNQLFHAIMRLEHYFDSKEIWLNQNDAHIYLDYLIYAHDIFVEIAKDIDLSYESIDD